MSTEPLGRSLGSAGQRLFIIGLVIVWASMLVSTAALAIEDNCETAADYDCTYHIEEKEIQKVPSFFKFQSRISQAKLPVGDVVFNNVIVNVKRGSQRLCREEFNDVVVRDSVLNLEIGREMENCVLEDKIAENSDLTFQICIGNEENCLKPIALSSVPYAIKSSYSFQAEKAHRANEATQAHYAHRVTADRDLFLTNRIGVGFYDFHTPSLEKIDILHNAYSSAMSYPWEDGMYQGGYMQWVQRDLTVPSNFHITARFETAAGEPMPLDFLVVHAEQTHMLGKLVVEGQADYDPDTNYEGAAMAPALTVNRGMEVNGRTYMDHNVTMGSTPGQGRTCVVNHDLYQYGDSNFEANNTFRKGTTTFEDETTLVSYGAVTMGGGSNVHFRGTTNFDTETNFNAPLNVTESGSVNVASGSSLDVYGPANFWGPVNINGNSSGIIPADNSVGNVQIKNNDIFYMADLYIANNLLVADNVYITENGINITAAGTRIYAPIGQFNEIYVDNQLVSEHLQINNTISGNTATFNTINSNNIVAANQIQGSIQFSAVSGNIIDISDTSRVIQSRSSNLTIASGGNGRQLDLLSVWGIARCTDIFQITIDAAPSSYIYQQNDTGHYYRNHSYFSELGATQYPALTPIYLNTVCHEFVDENVSQVLIIRNFEDFDVEVTVNALVFVENPLN